MSKMELPRRKDQEEERRTEKEPRGDSCLYGVQEDMEVVGATVKEAEEEEEEQEQQQQQHRM